MSLSKTLANLQELPAPELPAFWPQTWGWWVIFVVSGLLVSYFVFRRLLAFYQNRYRREALAELAQLEQTWREQPDSVSALRDLPVLMKRVVLYVDMSSGQNRAQASLSLCMQRLATEPVADDVGRRLVELAYAPDHRLLSIQPADLIKQCRHWLETHRAPV
ncbi:DUF4381 domain-containing protein [Marinobacter litoralis]|uniref:DUF4381 domain-containing protein n=1 Tax=Marinobacter litoralis TaxID=187981 RepID=UPI0018ECA3F8|nr:DUF4381 domain-containing protein [Marinobacter litoralis]MBJ6138492.1 DUF4381 domain-containing protein [Marinobacter litoralis]